MMNWNSTFLILLINISSGPAHGYFPPPESHQEIFENRDLVFNKVLSLHETLAHRHQKDRWPVAENQKPNPNYTDGFEITRERFIDNKDRHDIEKEYLERALNDNFYLSSQFDDYVKSLTQMSDLHLKVLHNKMRFKRFGQCRLAQLRWIGQASLDALPIASAIQAELWDKLVDKNSHSPASGFSGILGGMVGSSLEGIRLSDTFDGTYVDRALEALQKGLEEEFDGGLWSITKIVWQETLGVNSPCYITSRMIEAIAVERTHRSLK